VRLFIVSDASTVIAIPLADGALISRSLARCKPWAAPAGGQGAAVL